MLTINRNIVASMEFKIAWESENAAHFENYFARKVNFWRDILPPQVTESLSELSSGEQGRLSIPLDAVKPYNQDNVLKLGRDRFERRLINGRTVEPRIGRFYPKGLLKGLNGIFPGNIDPFRCIEVDQSSFTVDLNHPLASRNLHLEVSIRNVRKKQFEIGGAMNDLLAVATEGPGMQVRWRKTPTDFFSDTPFLRTDENPDKHFYEHPRLVTHLDSQALAHVSSLYGNLLKPGMRVLDLMSSWKSHLPESLKLSSVTGLGLNADEMMNNPQLSSHVVHDLNANPNLPFDNDSFDAVICTVSVEYMTRPLDVFLDCARVLKPCGICVTTFSNRWFPPKVTRIWTELSEFERMGLVMEYFLRSGAYGDIETHSFRGWPRPASDRYYPQVQTSDPIFAVLGRKIR
ncbi:MAG: hypothetical protein Kow0099_00270 [Candidatus Abyssubacteria bacterium]